MKMRNKLASVLSAVMLAVSALPGIPGQAADGNKIRIMPLGDSITYGMQDEGGYRKFLWQKLIEKGYDNIDFVGPEGQDRATFTYKGQQVSYDDNHAGYSGYTITNLPGGWMGQLNGILETMQGGDYITKYAPDIILLQIGTNDINNGHLDGSEERLHQLLDYLREKMPADGTIFLTTIPDLGNMMWGGNSSETNRNIASYNELVKKVADDYKEKHVIFADIHSVIDASKDLADGVHPNAGGYEKMGEYWAEQLDTFFKSGQGSSSGQSSDPGQGTVTQPQGNLIPGDVNADGTVNASDLSALKKGVIGKNTDKDFIKRADINESGVVNQLDADMLRNFLIGKIRQFEKGASEITEPPKENKWDSYQETADARYLQFYKDSIYSMGNTYRLVKKLEAAENGEKLTMAYLGGSITEMGKYTTPFSSYVKSTFAKGGFTEVNAGLSGTSSVVGLVRSEPNVISKNPDIVFVEFSVNDHEDIMYKKCFESVIKRFLDLPNEPAVIILIHRAKSGFSSQQQMVPVGQNFDIPIISMDNALTKAFQSGLLSQGDYFSDDYHPHDKGGKLVSDCLSYFFRQAMRTENRSDSYTVPTKTIYGTEYENCKYINPKDMSGFSAGSWTAGGGYNGGQVLPYSYTVNGGSPMKFKATGKGLIIVFKANSSGMGSIDVTVNGKTTKVSGNKQYCWGGPDAELGYYQDASGELDVSISGNPQFTIWGIGLVE
ncbi:MAG: hypothetical protein IKH27_04370 [Oscillospiraceae bacterium]|nr:hypothetical protein [Oscillospiraceae bacterium]